MIWDYSTQSTSLKVILLKRKSDMHLVIRVVLVITFALNHYILKKVEVYRKIYKDSNDDYNTLFEYIKSLYNHWRSHSSLGDGGTRCSLCRRRGVKVALSVYAILPKSKMYICGY